MTNARVILTICLAVVPALLFPEDSISREKVLPDRRYSIHTASYANSDGARREVQMWKAAGYAAFVRKVDLAGSGTWHRVYVGRFPTREDGARVAQKLKKEGLLDTFVLVSMNRGDTNPALYRALAERVFLRRSFDEISRENGFLFLVDLLHLNTRGATRVADFIEAFITRP